MESDRVPRLGTPSRGRRKKQNAFYFRRLPRLGVPSRGTRRFRAAVTMSTEHTLNLRVRYPECDPMGYLHHSIYLQYFEMGRVELLRAMGHTYAELEQQGLFFVV